MKLIKTLILLIILGLLGTLVYQNQAYFLGAQELNLNLKWYIPQFPPLPNLAYWGICFGIGLLLTGMKGLFTAFRLGREIKVKTKTIDQLKEEINTLKTELNVFTHDPYISKRMAQMSGKGDVALPDAEPEAAPVADTVEQEGQPEAATEAAAKENHPQEKEAPKS